MPSTPSHSPLTHSHSRANSFVPSHSRDSSIAPYHDDDPPPLPRSQSRSQADRHHYASAPASASASASTRDPVAESPRERGRAGRFIFAAVMDVFKERVRSNSPMTERGRTKEKVHADSARREGETPEHDGMWAPFAPATYAQRASISS
jgi:hypothetical protein